MRRMVLSGACAFSVLTFLLSGELCVAIRLDEVENLIDKESEISQEEAEAAVTMESNGEQQDSDKSSFWASCPSGLETITQENWPTLCAFKELDLFQAPGPELPEGVFDFHSNQPIYFNRDSEAINISLAFASEFFDALEDNDTFHLILNDFGQAEIDKNETFKEDFARWATNISGTAFGDGSTEFWSSVHNLEEGLLPAIFIIEHYAEHAIIGGAIYLLHVLEHAAAHEVVFGEAFLANVFGISLVSASSALGHSLHFVLHYIITPLLVEKTIVMILAYQKMWLTTTNKVEDFVNRLMLRSTCAVQLTAISGPIGHPLDAKAIHPVVDHVCGQNQTAILSTILTRAHKTIAHVFGIIVELGECMNPEGDNDRAKTSCANRLYRPLRQDKDLPGILWSALVYMATVMRVTDDLLIKPHYGNVMESHFGVTPPPAGTTGGFSELQDLIDVNVTNAGLDRRFITCYSIIATHRAFETSLARVAQSLQVYSQTFARRYTAPVARAISWKPCQKIFEEFHPRKSPNGFCKRHKVNITREQEIALKVPCSSPMNWPQWQCHERHWLMTREDGLWCKHVGTFKGYEYRDFGVDHTRCGCECCKRENAGRSLWPELESGGGH